jgi:hypothetical protein
MRRRRRSRRRSRRKRKKKIKRKTAVITYLVVKLLQNVATENSGVVYATILKFRNMR